MNRVLKVCDFPTRGVLVMSSAIDCELYIGRACGVCSKSRKAYTNRMDEKKDRAQYCQLP